MKAKRPDNAVFIVEVKGSKGWEIVLQSPMRSIAIRAWADYADHQEEVRISCEPYSLSPEQERNARAIALLREAGRGVFDNG